MPLVYPGPPITHAYWCRLFFSFLPCLAVSVVTACDVAAGRAPQFDTNAAFDVTDDDFAIDGTFDIETFVRQEAQDRRVAREGETTDPRMFDD